MLVLNDHIFKQLFHNWITGKLSDVVGLFAFAIFCLAVCSHRKAQGVLLAVGTAFIFWKTELSEPFLGLINGIAPLTFYRVVDYSDLGALVVLPAAARYAQGAVPLTSSQIAGIGMGAVSLVAFVATSRFNLITYHEDAQPTYEFNESAWTVVLAINEHFDPDPLLSFSLLDAFRQKKATTLIWLKQSCISGAHIVVREQGQASEVVLVKAYHRCSPLGRFDEKVRGKDGPVSDAFEKSFIEDLREILVAQKSR